MTSPGSTEKTDLESFLASVEKQAFRMARFAAGGSTEDGLDIVQDTMLSFVRKYSDKPAAEQRPLFFRVLQSRIRDWQRRQTVRRRWRAWLDNFSDRSEKDAEDPMARVADKADPGPEKRTQNRDAMDALEEALHKLPTRQQQVFLLRVWEGLSVAETAATMGCSAGSVKSHYSRAVRSLRKDLEDHWP